MMEEWRDIDVSEYTNMKYQISNLGRIKSLNHNHTKKDVILNLKPDKKGYYKINFHKGNKQSHIGIHKLVAKAFIPNPNNLPIVNHKDENPSNNCVDNLEWCTYSYNTKYGTGSLRAAQKHYKPVLQYDVNGNFIKEWEGIKIANEALNISIGSISKCCNGVINTAKGYVWKYKK